MAGRDQSFLRRFHRKEECMLKHEFPQLFYASQCRMPVWLYVMFRLLLVAVTSHSLALALYYSHDEKFPIFFTHWTYFVQMVTMIYKLVVVVCHVGLCRCQSEDFTTTDEHHHPKMPIHLKIKWILHNISTIMPFIVTAVYWAVLFPGEDKSEFVGMRAYIDVEMHAGNSVVALLDFFISAVPFRLYHFVHTVIYGLIYVGFALVYYLYGGTGINGNKYIYYFLDFGGKAWITVVAVLGIFAAIVVLHLLFAFFKHMQSKRVGPCGTFCSHSNYASRARQRLSHVAMPPASKRPVNSDLGGARVSKVAHGSKVTHAYVNEPVEQSNAI